MNNFLQNSVFFGVFISIITYEIGVLIKKKLKIAIFNPLLISMALIIIFLLIFHVDYDTYESGAKIPFVFPDTGNGCAGGTFV